MIAITTFLLWSFLFLSHGSQSDENKEALDTSQSDENKEALDTCQAEVTPDCNPKAQSSQIYSSEFEKHVLPEPTRVYKTKNVSGVYVFDDVFSLTSLIILERYNEIAGKWKYRSSNVHGLAPWLAPLNPNKVAQTNFGKTLQQVVTSVSGKNVQLFDVEFNIMRRQDYMKVFFGCDAVGSEFTAVVYMNQIWRKNDYGDAIFYERDQDLALASIKPKYGRLLVFDSTLGFLSRPPSVNFRAGQLILVARFTNNYTRVEEKQAKFEADVEEKERNTLQLFHGMPAEKDTKKNIQEHFVKHYKSASGKQIFVFDDLFRSEDLDKIQQHVLNYGDFYYDDSFDFDSDNVVWIAAYSVEDFVGSRMWPIVQQVASFSSGKDTWFPYDISLNIVRSADSTRIHEDCEEHEDEWTFLLYLNPDWSPDCYGETAFFETTADDSEVIATVLPKYGRAVIFEGIIPHSARPPSSTFNGTRLSFAVKLSVTEKIGRKKLFLQSFDHELALHYSALNILDNHDRPEFESLYRSSLMSQIDMQRKVDWRLAEYSFQGATTDSSMDVDVSSNNEWGEEDDNDDEDGKEEEENNDDEDEFKIMEERRDYIYNLLKKFVDDTDELKYHFLEFVEEHKQNENKYAGEVLNIF